jgi:hypothetical protein
MKKKFRKIGKTMIAVLIFVFSVSLAMPASADVGLSIRQSTNLSAGQNVFYGYMTSASDPSAALLKLQTFDGTNWNDRFKVDGTGNVTAVKFSGDGSGLTNINGTTQWTTSGSNIYYNTGNIGIGTANPDSLLEAAKVGSDTMAPQIGISGYANSTGNHGTFSFKASAGTAVGTLTQTSNGTVFGTVEGGGITTNSSYKPGASIVFAQDCTPGSDYIPGRISFLTGGSYGAQTEKMRIDKYGNVGIGTTDPQAKLHVMSYSSSSARPASIDVLVEDGSGPAIVQLMGSSGDAHFVLSDSSGNHWSMNSWASMGSGQFSISRRTDSSANWSYGGLGSWSNYFTITSGGNVGIGTNSATAKLEVAGQVKITGGSPGTGKVLTSDADGLASWQTPATGLSTIINVKDAYDKGTCTITVSNGLITATTCSGGV